MPPRTALLRQAGRIAPATLLLLAPLHLGLIAASTCTAGDLDSDGYTTAEGDCDDSDPAIHPGSTEVCNGRDDDCNDVVDEAGTVTYYADQDGDGFGNGGSSLAGPCKTPAGYTTDATDCDDASAAVHPGVAESCNEIDDNCDKQVDEGVLHTWYADTDKDGFGAASSGSVTACQAPNGYVESSTDCNDSSATINPSAAERCNGQDDNCNKTVDEGPGAQKTFYRDQDGDGFGSASSGLTKACAQPVGSSSLPTDCDDSSSLAYPAAVDAPADGLDADCDGHDGMVVTASPVALSSTPSRFTGEAANDSAGARLAAGDLDGNGRSDLLIGAPLNDAGGVDAGAVYVIDASMSGVADLSRATAKLIGENAGDGAGSAVASTGDVNGDGYEDVLVGAPGYDDGLTRKSVGAAYLLFGPLQGTIDLSLANARFVGESPNDSAGTSVALAGDVDQDGYDDLLVGATGASSSAGAVYLVYGSPSLKGSYSLSTAQARFTGEVGSAAGRSVAGVGDFTGDGFPDLLIGADGYTSSTGAAYLIPGSSSLKGSFSLSNTASWQVRFLGESKYMYTGAAVAGAGDLDGDGLADLIIGARGGAGMAHVMMGSADLKGSVNLLTQADARLIGEADTGGAAGSAVAGAGDVNGDGFADLLVGAPNLNGSVGGEGAAYLVLGPVLGDRGLSTADMKWSGDGNFHAGAAVVGAGDLNGDGLPDLGVGASSANYNGRDQSGAVYAWYGPISSSQVLSGTHPRFVGDDSYGYVGSAVAGAGDVDGDGLPDLLIGGPGYNAGFTSDNGATWLISGGALAAGDLSLNGATARIEGSAAEDQSGASVAGLGDVDGDGRSDLLIGAPLNDASGTDAGSAYLVRGPVKGLLSLNNANARFSGEAAGDHAGAAVAAARDVNGDGAADLLIGAAGYDKGSEIDAGAAYLFYGSKSLIGPLALSASQAKLVGEKAGDLAGAAVAGVGDVNGDGFEDLLIGAPGSDGGGLESGRAYLLFGPLSGLIDLASAPVVFTGEAAGDSAGATVAAAGDVNRDGYADLLIASPYADKRAGAVYLISGSSTLQGPIALSTASVTAKFTGEAAGDQLGSALAGGDHNGDGFSDVFLGAAYSDPNARQEGGAVYWIAGSGNLKGSYVVSRAARARFSGNEISGHVGAALAVPGDVTGDGFPDVLIGQPGYGGSSVDAGGAAYLLVWGR